MKRKVEIMERLKELDVHLLVAVRLPFNNSNRIIRIQEVCNEQSDLLNELAVIGEPTLEVFNGYSYN